MKYSVHVSKVVTFDSTGKLLVYQRDDTATISYPNQWDLLGGGVEANESPEQAAICEIQEEIGADLLSLSKLGEYEQGDDYLFHVFTGNVNAPSADLILTEGRKLTAIDLAERNTYIDGLLANALDDLVESKV